MQLDKINTVSKLLKGGSSIFLSDIARIVLNMLTLIFIARYIPQDQFGLFSLALICANFFAAISCVGLENSLPGFIAQKREIGQKPVVRGAIQSSYRITLGLSFFFMLVVFCAADPVSRMIGKPDLSTPLKIIAPAIPLIAIALLLTTFLRSFENYKGKIINLLAFPFLRLLLVAIIIYANLSFHAIVYSNTVSFFMVFLILFFYTKISLRDLFGKKERILVTKELFWYSLPILGSTIGRQLMMWTDTIMLGVFSSTVDVGVYSAGIRIIRLVSIIGVSINFVVLPIIARLYHQEKKQELQDIYHSIHGFVLLATLPVFWIFVFSKDFTMQLFFGTKLGSSNFFLAVLGVGWFVNAMFGVNTSILLALGKNKIQLCCFLSAIFVNIVSNFILVPLYSKTGAATASCIAFVIYGIFSMIMVNRYVGLNPFKEKRYIFLLAGSFLLTGGLYFLYEKGYFYVQSLSDIFVHITLYCLLSIVLALTSGFLRKQQLKTIKHLILYKGIRKNRI